MAEKPHTVLLFPSPNIGHLISMVELGKLLVSHLPSLSITILQPTYPFHSTSTSASSYISSISSAFPSISFHSLPPLPLLRSDYLGAVDMMFENLRCNNSQLHDFLTSLSISSHVSAVILDSFCYSSLEVTRSLRIPAFFFFTSGASVLAFFLNFPEFDKQVSDSFRNLGKLPLQIPELFSVPANHIIEPMLDRGPNYDEFLKMASSFCKSDGIIINTFESLEPRAVEALKDGTCLPGTPIPPVYPIGPLIASRGGGGGDRHECLTWLDSQPSGSVVYLAFGSECCLSENQLREMAVGLEKSGVRFLWVVRSPPVEKSFKQQLLAVPEPDLNLIFPDGFLGRIKGRGFVAKSWVPQIDILGHEAVGGFVTHCGWNSTLEAVCAGTPMVAWPRYAEQRFNKVLLVEELKIALPMEGYEEGFVSWDEIERRVKQVIESDEGEVIRKRVLELSVMAKSAIEGGGSSKNMVLKLVQSWKP